MKRPWFVALLICLAVGIGSDVWAQRRLFRFRRRPAPASRRAEGRRTLAPPPAVGVPARPTLAEPQQAGKTGPETPRGPAEIPAPLLYPLDQITPPIFSRPWYEAHPEAWRPLPPPADAFAGTDLSALALWLGLPELLGQADQEQPAQSASLGPTGPLLVMPGGERAQEAKQWMALGVFALRLEGQPAATRLIQLAAAPDGTIRGNHYDLITDAVQPIHGQVDRHTLRIRWSIGPEGSVMFEGPVAAVTRPSARWLAHDPDGQTTWWTSSRLRP